MQNEEQQQGNFRNDEYVSVTTLSSAANFIMNEDKPFTRTYRTYIRPRETGHLQMQIWHSNAVDSTWDMGQDAVGGESGGRWRIESAYLGDGGTNRDGSVIPGTLVPVTFQGSLTKMVVPGEQFCSDEVSVDVAEGNDLVFSWTISTSKPGKSVPYNVEDMLATAYDAEGDLAAQESSASFKVSDKLLVLPAFIGYKRSVVKNIVMLGDSITQGVRTEKDAYEYWAARIGEGLGPEFGLWNIGSGWGRAYDVSRGGAWLDKAKQGDEVLIVLGVNDIDIGKRTAAELLQDLSDIVSAIKATNPRGTILLSTVPPFNFVDEREQIWRSVNEEIRNHPPEGVDNVFDMAPVLALPEPLQQRIKPEYMSGPYDPHPNGQAGQAVAASFLEWYKTNGLS